MGSPTTPLYTTPPPQKKMEPWWGGGGGSIEGGGSWGTHEMWDVELSRSLPRRASSRPTWRHPVGALLLQKLWLSAVVALNHYQGLWLCMTVS